MEYRVIKFNTKFECITTVILYAMKYPVKKLPLNLNHGFKRFHREEN